MIPGMESIRKWKIHVIEKSSQEMYVKTNILDGYIGMNH